MAAQKAENKVGIEQNEEEEEEEEEVKWVNHYSSSHQILLVGEGDFSFSLCIALAFGSASNICASSLDSYDTVLRNYKKAKSNLDTLEKMGASVLHGVDATRMKLHPDLRMRKFDRIIFNFPHAGFLGKEDNHLVIGMHRNLVNGFFKNVSRMLSANGEVHVSHKTTAPFHSWNLEELASENSLSLIVSVDFKIEDYPSYNNKRGAGWRCDKPFPLGESSTFKFRFSPAAKKKYRAMNVNRFPNRRSLQLQEIPIQIQKQETSFDSRHCGMRMNEFPGHMGFPLATNVQRESPRMFYSHFSNVSDTFGRAGNDVDYIIHEPLRFESFGHPQRNFTRNMNYLPRYVGLPLTRYIQRERLRTFDIFFDNVRETHERAGDHVSYPVHGSYFPGSERCMEEAPGRTLSGDLYVINELQRVNTVRDYGDQLQGRRNLF
ncbi:hypothetical protein ACOSQ2_030483 [Xanthoceras sorbifolium]